MFFKGEEEFFQNFAEKKENEIKQVFFRNFEILF